MGERTSSRLGRGDLLARLGGKSLAVLLPGQCSKGARSTARQICEAIRPEPFPLPEGGRAHVTTSVGGAWGSSAALDMLTSRVEVALYAAEHDGRDRCRFAAERPVLADGGALTSESACADCALRSFCCQGQERGIGPSARAVA